MYSKEAPGANCGSTGALLFDDGLWPTASASHRRDAIAVVVSEETGKIAVAYDGLLIENLTSAGPNRPGRY